MCAVANAREIGAKTAKRSSSSAKDKPSAKGKQKARDTNDGSESDDTMTSKAHQTKLADSAYIIKKLGFDPAAKTGQKRTAQSAVQEKVRSSQLFTVLI
jgi:minichromosome maintenance protein 10